MDMVEIPTTISERRIHSNNHTAENNGIQNKKSGFSIMPSNARWQTLLICIDIYVFAMITRDWLEKTESMIETEIHYQHKQLN